MNGYENQASDMEEIKWDSNILVAQHIPTERRGSLKHRLVSRLQAIRYNV